MIRVWVIAPTTAMRIGLKALLQGDETLEVVGDSPSLADFASQTEVAEVLLMTGEEHAPDVQGLVPDRESDHPALLLLSDHPQNIQHYLHFTWRAWGVLPLEAAPAELSAAIAALHAGLLVGAPELMMAAFDRQPAGLNTLDEIGEKLTPREEEVLQFLAQGLANKQIGLALGISEHTVKFHVSAIYAKLGVTNRTEAVRVGIQRGWIVL